MCQLPLSNMLMSDIFYESLVSCCLKEYFNSDTNKIYNIAAYAGGRQLGSSLGFETEPMSLQQCDKSQDRQFFHSCHPIKMQIDVDFLP